jgi:hypothetical protein
MFLREANNMLRSFYKIRQKHTGKLLYGIKNNIPLAKIISNGLRNYKSHDHCNWPYRIAYDILTYVTNAVEFREEISIGSITWKVENFAANISSPNFGELIDWARNYPQWVDERLADEYEDIAAKSDDFSCLLNHSHELHIAYLGQHILWHIYEIVAQKLSNAKKTD